MELAKLWDAVGYEPHEKQRVFHDSEARFKIAVCGRRFGKSKMGAMENLVNLFDESKPGRGWIVGPTYETAEEPFAYIWDAVMVKLGMRKLVDKASYNLRTGEMYIEFPWGTRVDVKSAQHPETLIGKGLRWVLLEEAAKLPKVVWEKYLRPALADYRGPATFISTPEGFNWYHDLYSGAIDDKTGQWAAWNFPSWENNIVYPGGFEDPEIQSQLAAGDDDGWFWQEIGAKFTSVQGLIYKEWNQDVHVKPWTYNPAVPNYLFFDFGFTNPFVCLDVQVTSSDEWHVWREYYVRQLPVHSHVQVLKGRPNPKGYNIAWAFGDAADPGAVEEIGRNLCGITADPLAKDVVRGIQEVKRMLRPPRLTIDPSCVNLIREFGTYRMKPPPRTGEDSKEQPLKVDDHALDALRYGAMHLNVMGAGYSMEDVLIGGGTPDTFFQWGDMPRITMGGDIG